MLIPPMKKNRSIFNGLVILALGCYLVSNLIYIFDNSLILGIRFLNIGSLVCTLSALFNLIRESKPVFARFPLVLSFLPFSILLFVPFILEQTVIFNLLLGTFQAGCIVVSLMIFILNQINNQLYKWQIVGSITSLLSFSIFWFTPEFLIDKVIITELLLTFSIYFIVYGVQKPIKKD